jgi:hypothetical protein
MVTMIEMYHTLLKQHNCNLNMCELDKIGLSGYDLDQDVIWITMIFRYGIGFTKVERNH